MHETTEQYPRKGQPVSAPRRERNEREDHKIVAERHAAVRRWIDDDDTDDVACRGID
jgi:hypothetical protein